MPSLKIIRFHISISKCLFGMMFTIITNSRSHYLKPFTLFQAKVSSSFESLTWFQHEVPWYFGWPFWFSQIDWATSFHFIFILSLGGVIDYVRLHFGLQSGLNDKVFTGLGGSISSILVGLGPIQPGQACSSSQLCSQT